MQFASLNEIITTAPPRLRRHSHALLLSVLFLAEAVLFYVHVARDVAPFYPPNFDQLFYYLATYDLIGAFHTRGFGVFVDELLLPSSATGATFVLQGALLSLIGGENRTTLLSINLLYLLALQLVFFVVIRSRTGRVDAAWIGVALLLSLSTLFNVAGGIYDYRIDFSALCLYGIWASLTVWSGSFHHAGRSVLVALVGIVLICSRFFTIIYVAGVLAALLSASLVAIWRTPSTERNVATIRRAHNILLSGVIIAVVCLPRLFLSRDAIYGYYMIGHVLGEEKYIRAHELGVYSIAGHLLYYPRSILVRHVGLLAWLIAGALAGWALWRNRLAASEMPGRLRPFGHELTALGVAILIPVAALTANVAKSPVVGGIVTVPILVAMVLFGAALWPRGGVIKLTRGRAISVSAVAMAIALAAFAIRGTSSRDVAPRADLERIAMLARSIATFAADNKLDRLSMSTDRVVDYQNVGTVKLASIELLHRSLEVDGLLGHGPYGIFATSREDALRLLAESDVIVLTDPVTDRSHPYPINAKIKEYWDELWQWTNENRVQLFSTEILGIPYRVFVRSLPSKEHPLGRAPTDDSQPQ